MAHQYSQDDIQQILHLAISRQTHHQDDLSREQLLEIAEEMGITVQALDEAERLWLVRKEKLSLEQQFDQYRQQRFRQSGTKYLIVMAFWSSWTSWRAAGWVFRSIASSAGAWG